jgi:hypothetical protein
MPTKGSKAGTQRSITERSEDPPTKEAETHRPGPLVVQPYEQEATGGLSQPEGRVGWLLPTSPVVIIDLFPKTESLEMRKEEDVGCTSSSSSVARLPK